MKEFTQKYGGTYNTELVKALDDLTTASTAAATTVQDKIKTLTSTAGAGGGATEAMVLTGLLTTDTILSVTQKTKGANSLPLLGYSTQAANALTGIWSADPGAGAVIVVTVLRLT